MNRFAVVTIMLISCSSVNTKYNCQLSSKSRDAYNYLNMCLDSLDLLVEQGNINNGAFVLRKMNRNYWKIINTFNRRMIEFNETLKMDIIDSFCFKILQKKHTDSLLARSILILNKKMYLN